eukprot:7190059-Pyramimonas_sp.AAC.1
MHLRPVQNGEKRLQLDGAQFLFNEHETTVSVDVPPHLWTYLFVIATHRTDRSSINSSLLHFLTAEKYLFVPCFDSMRALWNALKNSAKRVGP